MLSKSRREAYFWNRLGSDDREFEESLSDRAKDYFSSMLSGDVESKKKCEILLYSPERSFWAGNWTDAEARIYQEGRGWKAKARFPGLDGDGAAERLERLEKELDTFYTSRLDQKHAFSMYTDRSKRRCDLVSLTSTITLPPTASAMAAASITGEPFMSAAIGATVLGSTAAYEAFNDFHVSDSLGSLLQNYLKDRDIEHVARKARSILYNQPQSNGRRFFDNLSCKNRGISLPDLEREEMLYFDMNQMLEIEFHNFEFMEGLSVWTQHESYKEAREFVSKVSGKEIEQSQEPDIYQNPRALLSIINDVAQRKTTFEIALESDPLRAEIIGKALDKGIPEDMLSRIKREFSGSLRRAQELGYGQEN